ncbi:unnamed protein product [marine sediment metagenome]|uniref:Uncharacterized protein n=1 Tax=marine sediment metagenome TaxID=412755 RepID=X1I4Z5_9ZZZZ
MAEKSKSSTITFPREVADLIEELIEARGLWPSVSAFVHEACLEKIEKEQKRIKELKEDES